MRLLRVYLAFTLTAGTWAFIEAQELSFSPFMPAVLANNNTPSTDSRQAEDTPPFASESIPQSEPILETNPDDATSHDLELRSLPPTATYQLERRQNPCASTYAQCPQSPSLCCPSNAQCLPDAAGMVGCCPNGAACTGIVPNASPSPSSTSTGTATSTQNAAQSVTSSLAAGLASLTSSAFVSGETVFAAAAPPQRVLRNGEAWGVVAGAVGGALLL